MAKKQKTESITSAPAERIYRNEINFKSDLFKLEVASCNHNKGWNGAINLEEIEHVHFFHTYDSDGKKLLKSNMVAGHFHVIEYKEQGNNKPVEIISVSGPMIEVRKKIKGKWTKVIEPVAQHLEDNHTHDITYRRSENVKAREIAPEAVNIVAQEAQKTAAIPGVSMG